MALMVAKAFQSLSDDVISIIKQYAYFCTCDEEEVISRIKALINSTPLPYGSDAYDLRNVFFIKVFKNGNVEIVLPQDSWDIKYISYNNNHRLKYFELRVPGAFVGGSIFDDDDNFFLLKWTKPKSINRKEFIERHSYLSGDVILTLLGNN
jgi:hypothetical protein